jgi:hypothetical protein
MVEYSGVIENAGGGGAFILFPYDTLEIFGKKNLVPVIVTYDNAIEYKGRIANMGKGPMIPILKSIREQLKKEFGDSVHLTVVLDNSERKIETPDWLNEVYKSLPEIQVKFEKLSYTHQKEHIRAVEDAKKEETKIKRIEKMIEMLSKK